MRILHLFRQPSSATKSGRVLRGFWRLGYGAALVIGLLGTLGSVGGAVYFGFEEYSEIQTISCLKQKTESELVFSEWSKDTIDEVRSGCPGRVYATVDSVRAYSLEAHRWWPLMAIGLFIGGVLASFLASILSFLAIRGAGWIIAGFFSD